MSNALVFSVRRQGLGQKILESVIPENCFWAWNAPGNQHIVGENIRVDQIQVASSGIRSRINITAEVVHTPPSGRSASRPRPSAPYEMTAWHLYKAAEPAETQLAAWAAMRGDLNNLPQEETEALNLECLKIIRDELNKDIAQLEKKSEQCEKATVTH